ISALCGSRPYELEPFQYLPDVGSLVGLASFISILHGHLDELLQLRAAPADQRNIVVPVPPIVVALVKWRAPASLDCLFQLVDRIALGQPPLNLHLTLAGQLGIRVARALPPILKDFLGFLGFLGLLYWAPSLDCIARARAGRVAGRPVRRLFPAFSFLLSFYPLIYTQAAGTRAGRLLFRTSTSPNIVHVRVHVRTGSNLFRTLSNL